MKDRICLCMFYSRHQTPFGSRRFQTNCFFIDSTNTVMATNSTCTDKQPFVDTHAIEKEKLKNSITQDSGSELLLLTVKTKKALINLIFKRFVTLVEQSNLHSLPGLVQSI